MSRFGFERRIFGMRIRAHERSEVVTKIFIITFGMCYLSIVDCYRSRVEMGVGDLHGTTVVAMERNTTQTVLDCSVDS